MYLHNISHYNFIFISISMNNVAIVKCGPIAKASLGTTVTVLSGRGYFQ